jgi:hypothetical protein
MNFLQMFTAYNPRVLLHDNFPSLCYSLHFIVTRCKKCQTYHCHMQQHPNKVKTVDKCPLSLGMGDPGSGGPWEWCTLGVGDPGNGGPWEWQTLGVQHPNR